MDFNQRHQNLLNFASKTLHQSIIMSDDRLPSIDKLDGTNWSIWKEQVKTYLIFRRLWKFCQGTAATPVRELNETDGAWSKREEDF